MKKQVLILFILFVLLLVSFVSANQLKVTDNHPFLINNSWIQASQLQVGDLLTTIDGKKARIKNIIDIEEQIPFLVYNIEDDIFHNYIVGENKLVVHNSGCSGTDCILGRQLVDVIYPNRHIERVRLDIFVEMLKYEPYLKIIGSDGSPIPVLLGEAKVYSGQVITFKIEGINNEIRLTGNHKIILADGTEVSAGSLRTGMRVRTPGGGNSKVTSFELYDVNNIKVYDPVTTQPYSVFEGGPLMKSSEITEGWVAARTPQEIAAATFNERDIYVRFEWIRKADWPEEGTKGNLPFIEDLVNKARGRKISVFKQADLERIGYYRAVGNEQKKQY